MLIKGTTLRTDVEDTADVVVIGSGAGGAVVCKELTDAGMKVVMLEEGAQHIKETHVDLASQAIRRLYKNQALSISMDDPYFAIPTGRALGGTTVINSGTCFRIPDRTLRKWRGRYGLDELTSDALRPHFEKVEKEIHVEPSDFKVMARSNTLFREILEKNGMKGAPILRNIKNCLGCGMCCYGCTSGAKQSMDQNYIPKAMAAGAKVYTECRATQIVTERGRASEVVAEVVDHRDQKRGIRVRVKTKLVVLAAGTFGTPSLIRRSRLSSSPWLGRNLSLHPATKVYAEFEEKINGWVGTPQAYETDLFHDEGLLFEGVFVPPDLASFMNPFVGKKLHDFMKSYAHMATFGVMVEDEGRGRVFDLPLLGSVAKYKLAEEDGAKLLKAMAFMAELFLKAGAKRVIPMVHDDSFEMRSISDVDKFRRANLPARKIEIAAFHPLGTARMGVSPHEGVIDKNGKIFGQENIYVADGSIFPSSLGVNPQLTIMAFADRIAKGIAQRA